MRPDMDRVLVLRGRMGGGRGSPNRRSPKRPRSARRGPLDELPFSAPMSRGRGTKYLAENLAPLRRFLLRRISQPWNDVYAEICACIDGSNAVQQHVLVHLDEMVARHPFFLDGLPHASRWNAGGGRLVPLYRSRWQCCHVDDDGTLRVNPDRPGRRRRRG